METYGYNNPESQQNQNFSNGNYRSEKKLAAGLLGILLGTFGANKLFFGLHQRRNYSNCFEYRNLRNCNSYSFY